MVRLGRLAIASAVLLVACGGSGDETISAFVREQVADARDAATPDGVQLKAVEGPTRQKGIVSASWAFDLRQPWSEYQAWLLPRLGARGYQRSGCDDHVCLFSRELPGDVLTVVVRASGDPVQVHVAFMASPD